MKNMKIASENESVLIDKDKWQQLSQIMEGIAGGIPEKNTKKEQIKVWRKILKIREKYRKNIHYSLRILAGMCYDLGVESQLREILSPLLKFNYLLDQTFYHYQDHDYRGLKNFLKIFKCTFGNIREFKKVNSRVKDIFKFTGARKDKSLLRDYKYLQKISLPVSGYEELRINLITIMKKFKQLKPVIIDLRKYRQFSREINQFKHVYSGVYKKRHTYYYNKLSYLRRKVKTSPEYKTVKRLADIDCLKQNNNFNYLLDFLTEYCDKDVNNVIYQQPKCSCGFTIGDCLSLPTLNKFLPGLREIIDDYLEELCSNSRIRSRLEMYLQKHPGSGIKKILSGVEMEEIEGPALLSLINEEVIREINTALDSTASVVISLSDLNAELRGYYSYNNLAGVEKKFRTFLDKKIREHIDREAAEDIIIKLT